MSLNLSQEEIDALLNAGLGGGAAEPEESAQTEPSEFEQPQAAEPSADATGFAQQSARSRAKMRKSVKVEEGSTIQPAVFPDFDEDEPASDITDLGIILNLDLEIRVELGKTKKSVHDVLEMGAGSVLELKKLNGEPVDLIVNGKLFSKGEMIVIGENFGVRVTDILTVPEIIEALR